MMLDFKFNRFFRTKVDLEARIALADFLEPFGKFLFRRLQIRFYARAREI